MHHKPILLMSPGSHHARRVRMLIYEMNLEIEERVIDVRPPSMGGENERSEFLSINPAGKVPVLQDGDLTITESNAIMMYLAESKGPTDLWPVDDRARAQISQWQFFQAAHLSPTADGFLSENVLKPMLGQSPDKKALDGLVAQLRRWFQVLEHTLVESDYLVGNEPTIADLSVACAFMYERAAQIPISESKTVETWLRVIQERESWSATEPPVMSD